MIQSLVHYNHQPAAAPTLHTSMAKKDSQFINWIQPQDMLAQAWLIVKKIILYLQFMHLYFFECKSFWGLNQLE